MLNYRIAPGIGMQPNKPQKAEKILASQDLVAGDDQIAQTRDIWYIYQDIRALRLASSLSQPEAAIAEVAAPEPLNLMKKLWPRWSIC